MKRRRSDVRLEEYSVFDLAGLTLKLRSALTVVLELWLSLGWPAAENVLLHVQVWQTENSSVTYVRPAKTSREVFSMSLWCWLKLTLRIEDKYRVRDKKWNATTRTVVFRDG